MKRALYVAALVLAVVLAASCSMWEETTLTVVNNAGEDIELIRVNNGTISRGVIEANILTAPLADGELIKIPLAPVLHQDGSASIYIETGERVRTIRIDPNTDPNPTALIFESPFTYEEGAQVYITFNANGEADIRNGEFPVV